MRLQANTYRKGAIYSTSLSVVVKSIAFIQNFLIAYFLGAETGTDIYFYIFGGIIAGCEIIQTIASSVLIPYSMQLRNQNSFHEENSYLNAFIYTIACIIILILIIVIIAGESVFVHYLTSEKKISICTYNYYIFFYPLLFHMYSTSFLQKY